MFKRFIIISAALLICAPDAGAQDREYTSGINHATLNAVTPPAPPTAPKKKGLNSLSIERPDITTRRAEEYKKAQKDGDKSEGDEPSSIDRIWNKYKELASGTADKTAVQLSGDGGAPPAVPVPSVERPDDGQGGSANALPAAAQGQQAQEQPAKNTGIKYLLQQYQSNKEQQSQMRTRTLNVPSLKKTPSAESE